MVLNFTISILYMYVEAESHKAVALTTLAKTLIDNLKSKRTSVHEVRKKLWKQEKDVKREMSGSIFRAVIARDEIERITAEQVCVEIQ